MSKANSGKFVAKTNVKSVRKKPTLRKRICRFKRAVRQNRFYHFVLCVVVCLVVSFGSRVYQSYIDKTKLNEALSAQEKEIVFMYEDKINKMNDDHKESLDAVRAQYETPAIADFTKQEAEYIAKLLYPYSENSEEDLRTATWCVFNRVDSPGYPDNVKGVCQQESQWMGYSDSNPVLTDLYEIALEELETWHNNYRPVNKDYVYMSWSSKEIVLRNTWEITKDTRYWQAG